MMGGLFSIFDPSTGFGVSLNWMSLAMGLWFLPCIFWVLPSRWLMFWSVIGRVLLRELTSLAGSNSPVGFSVMVVGLLWFIVFNNFLGLFPYVFTGTAHILVTFGLAFPLWLGFLVYGWWSHSNEMFAHLVPEGTPSPLMVFMVLIETVSNLIRPITLSVRLAANMIAGHLLLALLGAQGVSAGVFILAVVLGAQILLLILEAAVAVIQAYVFMVLTVLYSAEVY